MWFVESREAVRIAEQPQLNLMSVVTGEFGNISLKRFILTDLDFSQPVILSTLYFPAW
jgi:hypothetical protein